MRSVDLLSMVEGRREEIRRRRMTEMDYRDTMLMTDHTVGSLWRVLSKADCRHARETCLEWINDKWVLLSRRPPPSKGGLGIDPMSDAPRGRHSPMTMASLEVILWAERLIGAGEDEVDRRGVI